MKSSEVLKGSLEVHDVVEILREHRKRTRLLSDRLGAELQSKPPQGHQGQPKATEVCYGNHLHFEGVLLFAF